MFLKGYGQCFTLMLQVKHIDDIQLNNILSTKLEIKRVTHTHEYYPGDLKIRKIEKVIFFLSARYICCQNLRCGDYYLTQIC